MKESGRMANFMGKVLKHYLMVRFLTASGQREGHKEWVCASIQMGQSTQETGLMDNHMERVLRF